MSNEGTLLQDLEKLRALMKPTISKEEAENCQKWAELDGATAFHLIERHAVNWADTRLMMDAWLQARAPRAEVVPLRVAPDVDGRDFYELCQQYRHSREMTPHGMPDTVQAFGNLRDYIKTGRLPWPSYQSDDMNKQP